MIFLTGIIYLNFYATQDNFGAILGGYAMSFSGFILLVRQAGRDRMSLTYYLAIGVICRLLLLWTFPELSDDIYRFIWDGKLMHAGLNPLEILPSDYVSGADADMKALYRELNSPSYYTVYPPLHQAVFYIATLGGWGWEISALIMKAVIILFEIVGFMYLIRILRLLDLPEYSALLYFLNPLVITEMTGNAHFEGIMLSFFLMSLYYLFKRKPAWSGVLMGMSVATKLLPLMFLPAVIIWLRKSDISKVGFLVPFGLTVTVLFLPMFYGTSVLHFADSLDLYFRKFEFNASVYFLLRKAGRMITGYNQISVIGPFLGLFAMGLIVWISLGIRRSAYTERSFLELLFVIYIIYLLSTTTLHPWYMCPAILLAVFNPKPWLFLWSFTVVLSYGLYSATEINMILLLWLEYGTVLLLAIGQKKIRRVLPGGFSLL